MYVHTYIYTYLIYVCMYVGNATRDENFPTNSGVMELKRPFSILSTQALK